MCTATWIRTEEGCEVFFNRDELRTRKPALPPRVLEAGGVRILAPVDGDAGGAWLGVNDRGLCVGLANGPGGEPDRPFRSRGRLVLDLLASEHLEQAEERLRGLDLDVHRPFGVFLVGPRREASVWRWDGRDLAAEQVDGDGTLLVSSSRDMDRAREERGELLARMRERHGRIDAKLLEAFHASHEPERGAWSPCMHREDASTVSSSRVRVDPREVAFAYRPGAPCEGAPVHATALALRPGS